MKSRRFFFRRSFLMLLPFLTAALVMIRWFSVGPIYIAVSDTGIIPETISANIGYEPLPGTLSPAQQEAKAFNEAKRFPDFLQMVADRANLSPPIQMRSKDDDPRRERLIDGLNAYASSERVFTISLVWNNAAEAERLTDAAVAQFRQERTQDRTAELTAAILFLSGEIDRLTHQIKNASNPTQNNAQKVPDAVQNAVGENEMVQLRKFLALRSDLLIKNKLAAASAASTFMQPVPARATPAASASKLVTLAFASFLFGVLLSLILLAARSILEGRAGKVNLDSETSPAKERTDAQSDT